MGARYATTAQVAEILGRSPGYVRLLVSRGVLQPCDHVAGKRGRPSLMFDLHQVVRVLAVTPELDSKHEPA